MSYGDFKLFAAIGAWLGVQMLPIMLALACISCLLFIVINAGRQTTGKHRRPALPARGSQK